MEEKIKIDESKESNKRRVGNRDVSVAYILYGMMFLLNFKLMWFSINALWAVVLIYVYIRRHNLEGTVYYSHMNYIICTCWWIISGVVTSMIIFYIIPSMSLIGIIVLTIVTIWAAYRWIIGYVAFKDGKAI